MCGMEEEWSGGGEDSLVLGYLYSQVRSIVGHQPHPYQVLGLERGGGGRRGQEEEGRGKRGREEKEEEEDAHFGPLEGYEDGAGAPGPAHPAKAGARAEL